ncbi:DYNLRB1, partial [Symbiodinium microadriaticum]
SEVEETIERIKVQPGVEGYVICNKQGQVLRRFPTMTQETAEQYSEAMMSLSSQARSVVRDLNPKNELKYLRVRAKRHEIMVAF